MDWNNQKTNCVRHLKLGKWMAPALAGFVFTLMSMQSFAVAATEFATSATVQEGTVTIDPNSDYIDQILGTPIPSHDSPAEIAVKPETLLPIIPLGTLKKADSKATAKGNMFNSRGLMWPMRRGYVSSRYGMRWGRLHQGTDIAAPMGTPILAAASGKVVFSGIKGGYGQLIIVDHGNGVQTKYGHCSKRLVALGETVHQGDVIGKVGNTGHTTGPHLHYEVIGSGKAKNPEYFTRRR